MGLVAQVRRTLERRGLLPGGTHVLVACSGGPDSTALLYALHELAPAFGLRLTAAAIDHGFRPEAREEIVLASDHARALGIDMRIERVDVDVRRGKQAGARAARYAALATLGEAVGATAVATGHTLDDQAETVLGRLLRSPSVWALAGIQPRREDGVVRPLIDCRRADVLRFVRQRGLAIAHDPSNGDVAYTRTRVRQQWLPALQSENPRLVEALAALADDAQGYRELAVRSAPLLDLTAPEAIACVREQSAAVRRYLIRQWLLRCTGVEPRLEQVEPLAGCTTRSEIRLAGDWAARWQADGSLATWRISKRARGR